MVALDNLLRKSVVWWFIYILLADLVFGRSFRIINMKLHMKSVTSVPSLFIYIVSYIWYIKVSHLDHHFFVYVHVLKMLCLAMTYGPNVTIFTYTFMYENEVIFCPVFHMWDHIIMWNFIIFNIFFIILYESACVKNGTFIPSDSSYMCRFMAFLWLISWFVGNNT